MRNRMVIGRAAIALMLVALFAVGCNSDKHQASGVASQFLDAMKTGSPESVKPLLTKAAQAKLDSQMVTSISGKDKFASYSISDTVVTDETAVVSATVTDDKNVTNPISVKLKKEDSSWKVYALGINAGTTAITLDFEHPEDFMSAMLEAMGKQVGGAMKALGDGFKKGMSGAK